MNFEMRYETECFTNILQQIMDTMQVIERIKPAIGLWRELNRVENRLVEIQNKIIETNGKKSAYSNVLKMNPDKNITKAIETEVDRLNTFVEEILTEQCELDEYLGDIKENITEYNNYIHSFSQLNVFLLAEVLSRIDTNDKTGLVATVVLFTNGCIKEENKADIMNYLQSCISNDEVRAVVMSLTYNENAIYDYISKTDID